MSYTPIYVGQTYPPLHYKIVTDAGTPPPDLTGAAFQLAFHNVATNSVTYGTGAFSIIDTANGRVDYQWSAADVASAGTFEVTLIGTLINGKVLIVDPIPLEIRAL